MKIKLLCLCAFLAIVSGCATQRQPTQPSFTQLIDEALQYPTPQMRESALKALRPKTPAQQRKLDGALAELAFADLPERFMALSTPLRERVSRAVASGDLYTVSPREQFLAALSAGLVGETLDVSDSAKQSASYCRVRTVPNRADSLSLVHWYIESACAYWLSGNSHEAVNYEALAKTQLRLYLNKATAPVPQYLLPTGHDDRPYALKVFLSRLTDKY